MRLSEESAPRRLISLTPLIDVVFLLLVFFMLSSTFLRFSSIAVEASGGTGTALKASDLILVHVEEGGTLRLNGSLVPQDQFDARLSEIKSAGQDDVVLVMRPGTKVADLVKTLAQIRTHAFQSIRVVR